MGVAGCGKSSVGETLAASSVYDYLDGDTLHSQSNIAKMSAGTALTDADRWPWLGTIGLRFASSETPLAIGCSALKRSYREHILAQAKQPVIFIHLSGSKDLIAKRMSGREGHFMPTALLHSQFADLEELSQDERGFVVSIDQTPHAIVASINTKLEALKP